MRIPDGIISEYIPERASITIESTELIKCKHCKYYVEDVVNEVIPGVPIIMGHNMCTKWGNGCKTDPDGYCFMAEKEGEE
jgi:hypothetical protein